MPVPRRSSTLPLLALLLGLAAPGTVAAAEATAIVFAPGAAALDGEARAALDALAQHLASAPTLRLRLIAYAAPTDEARRLALARARAAWVHLTSRGVSGSRIAVRALGDRAAGDPPDRLDLIFEQP